MDIKFPIICTASALAMMVLMSCLKPAGKQNAAENQEEPAMETVIKDLPEAPNYDNKDAIAFGLLGKPSKIITLTFEATPGDDGLVRGELVEGSDVEMSFDTMGKVTSDLFGNVYEYDKDGNFLKGVTDYSKMTRDEKGRVAEYGNCRDEEDDETYTFRFSYDGNGRLSLVDIMLWEGSYQDVYTYEGNNVYPAKVVSDGDEQGEHYNNVTTYKYTKFDEQGNWTVREITSVSTTTVEDVVEETPAIRETTYSIEVRVIVYYK